MKKKETYPRSKAWLRAELKEFIWHLEEERGCDFFLMSMDADNIFENVTAAALEAAIDSFLEGYDAGKAEDGGDPIREAVMKGLDDGVDQMSAPTLARELTKMNAEHAAANPPP